MCMIQQEADAVGTCGWAPHERKRVEGEEKYSYC